MDIRGAFLLARVGFFFTPQFPSISTEGECVIGFTATVELLHREQFPVCHCPRTSFPIDGL